MSADVTESAAASHRHAGRVTLSAVRVVWAVAAGIVALTAVVMLTQFAGWDGVTVVVPVLHVLTPYLGVATAAVAVAALVARRLPLATAATAVGMSVVLFGLPVLFPGNQAPVAEGSTGLRVGAVNLLYRNQRIDDVAAELIALDADVLALSEFTGAHRRGLEAAGVADAFPHRIERPHDGPTGIAVWSRFPMVEATPPDTYTESLDVTVDGPDGAVRIVAVHLQSPVADAGRWAEDHDLIVDVARGIDGPTLIAGDFNSGYWHPAFRRLLDAGLTDAHIALGQGMTTSWPAHLAGIPEFVRLDHALVGGGLVATAVGDVEAPGSDHRGVVVSVAPAAR